MKALWICLLIFVPQIGNAAAKGCYFIAREKMQAILRDLPAEVIGSTTCYEKNPRIGSFLVARFHTLPEKSLHDYLLGFARHMVPDSIENVIVGEDKQYPNFRQIMVRSKRNNGKYDWHYAFTAKAADGSFIVFVHSGNQQETLTNESSLRQLRSQLIQPDFLAQIK